jgi:hypothetical protein
MATRLKTIEYAFPQNESSLASLTRLDLSAITIYIPETSSRTFQSVIVELTARDTVTTATSLSAILIGIKLGAASFSDATVSATLSNSGEQLSYLLTRSVTSYFNTNFGSGSSQTCQVGFMFTNPSTINHCVKLIITYSYDDSSATTRIRTARIPLDSTPTTLSTSLTSIGSNQVPALDTFLPESSKTYRCIWFQVEGNETAAGTTDFSLNLALDSESEDADGLHEEGLYSSCWYRRLWVRNDMATNSTHDLKASVTNTTGGTFNHFSVVLYVTYEYDHSNSSTVLNSLAIPFNIYAGTCVGTASGDADRADIKIMVEETSPTLVQSGIVLHWTTESIKDINISIGSQAFKTYADAGGLFCGGTAAGQRFDSGAGQGSGLSLARGENTLSVRIYSSTAEFATGMVGGVIYLNYTSSKHASGDGVHNHSVAKNLFAHDTFVRVRTATRQADIPETSYYISTIGAVTYVFIGGTASLVPVASLAAEYAGGEGSGNGFADLQATWGNTDTEAGVFLACTNFQEFFKHHPGCPDTSRMALTTSRTWAIKQALNQYAMADLWYTYHAITYSVSGSISGSSGGTVYIDLFRDDTDQKVAATSRSGNGSYSFTWYDNTINLYTVAYEDATHTGRSAIGTAS